MAILAQLGEAIFASTDRQQAVSLSSEMEALLTAANLRLNELLINAEEDIQLARQAHASAQRSAYIGLIVTALLAFGLAIGLALVFTRSISRPLAELADAADRITAGDLSTPVLVQGSGEVGQLAEAFERMRLTIIQERGQLRLLAVLEERDRIGREMHDGLAQVLGYVNTKAQAAQEFLKAGDDKAAERQLQELVGAAREAYTDAREVIVGLRMNGVPERGLAELADEYVERFRRQSGVAAELVVASSWWADALPAKVKVQALRIIQEALTNARKHARASRVVVSLETENDTAVISVEDDGCGFMLSRLLRPDFSRYGLRTMRERAQAVGGSLRIESAPGKGTCIIAILPLSEAAGVPV
jgi:signal transduction histidine kinase